MNAGLQRAQLDTHDLLPLARLEVDLRLSEGRPAEATALVTEMVTLPGIVTSPRYLWPLLVSGAHVPELLPRLRLLAAELPVLGPVQLAHRLTFTAVADPGPAAWDRATNAWAELGGPYPKAQSLVAAASATSDTDRLRAAAAQADRLSAVRLRAEIDRLAKALRLSLTKPGNEPDGNHGLTNRELEVLRLLAQGLTNRQIAAALYISAKTVSTHVSNILTKLAVPGRVQAAMAAHRLNLLSAPN